MGGLVAQSKSGFAGFSSVIMLGVLESIGIAALIVGTIFLAVLDYSGYAYFLLAIRDGMSHCGDRLWGSCST